jgi:hypothetical protein
MVPLAKTANPMPMAAGGSGHLGVAFFVRLWAFGSLAQGTIMGCTGKAIWAKLAQKLHDLSISFSTPFHSGEFDGQDRRRRDEDGERERSQVR